MDVAESPLPVSVESVIRDRAVRLFTYLKELTELRSEVKRTCEEYEQLVWWAEIPRENECYCAFWDLGREGTYEDWIRVERPRRKRAPAPPSSLAPWLNEREISDSSLEAPTLKESFVEVLKSDPRDPESEPETVVRKLEDFPAVTRQWEQYVEHSWWPWALEDRRLQDVQTIYNDLFAAYQTQERLGEAFETVVGVGLLNWKPSHGPEVRRHVVAAQVTVEFDAKTGSISVSPAAEGIRLTLEQDMLEPQDRPLPDIQNRLQERLSQIGDEVWTGPELISIIREYFQQLSPVNILDTSIEPLDGKREHLEPLMSLAPALVVRKRTERNMVRVFQEIALQLQQGATIPIGVEKLVAIRDDRTTSQNGDVANANADFNELYFPLPANDAQREIAALLESRQGVLVQGPPGTGKSHTIANLVCHLLATGKRLLVTSHTARALRVLKGYFPEEIVPLCVSLLGDDAIALRELEESVQGILSKLNAWEPQAAAEKIRDLTSSLDRTRRELANAYSTLRQFRKSEAGQVDLGFQNYIGTPQALAEKLNIEVIQHGWLKEDVSLSVEAPITNPEILELLQLIREFRPEDGDTAKRSLPPIDFVITPNLLSEIVQRESDLRKTIASANPADERLIQVLAQASSELRHNLQLVLQDLEHSLKSLSDGVDEWTRVGCNDVLSGKHLAWKELHELTIVTIEKIADELSSIAQVKVSGIDGRDLSAVRADAEELRSHLSSGKSIGLVARNNPFLAKHVKSALYLTTEVRVAGKLCDSVPVIEDLLKYLRVTEAFGYLEQCWSVCVAAPNMPLQLALADYRRRAELLQRVLALREKIESAKTLWRQVTQSVQLDWKTRESVASLMAAVEMGHSQAEFGVVEQTIAIHIAPIKDFLLDSNAHPVLNELLSSIETREVERYSKAYQELIQSYDLRARYERRRLLESKISKLQLLMHLWETASDRNWEKRLGGFEQAWNWARANDWLKTFTDPTQHNAILQQVDLSQKRIRQDLASLASHRAWGYVLSCLEDAQREHLIAWRLAIRKIGKGTGKYASQYRKEARYHLDHCRGAIPAWVMPIYRVAESTKPSPNLFDVAIIDEASQSGPEALFLQYIAKKIVVVGDDQQISPDSVGLDRESVDTLRQRYIRDIPMWDALGVDNSFFDQAQIRFSGRVRLREHFRCMPEIIQFSNKLCYEAEPLIPLRQYGAGRLEPVLTRYIPEGYVKGTGDRTVNPPEAEAIATQIEKCIENPAYEGKSFGVICLQGNAQWNLIRDLLLERVGAQRLQQRRLAGGNAYAFQGDERDVIFLSMVAAPTDGRHIGVLSKESDKRRFNVAASRARDQMWLFHSVTLEDLSTHCFRRKLLEHCLNPNVRQEDIEGIEISQLQRQAFEVDRALTQPPSPFDSWFEVDVFLKIVDRGFRVVPQFQLAGKRIDLLVEGMKGRLAVECDGDQWHGIAEWDNDIDRQRMLVRCGLEFWRVRGSAFYRDQSAALAPLWRLLEERGVYPKTIIPPTPIQVPSPETDDSEGITDSLEDEVFEVGTDAGLTGEGSEEESPEVDERAPPFPDLQELDSDVPFSEYFQWTPHTVPDPHSASIQELMESLIEIVSVEGPMVCRRAYQLYTHAAGYSRLGRQLEHVMNRAIYRAVRLGRLQQNDERKRGGQKNQVVRLPGTPEVVVRKRGPRSLGDIPHLEVTAIREFFQNDNPGCQDEILVRKIAAVFGIRRMTEQIRKQLLS